MQLATILLAACALGASARNVVELGLDRWQPGESPPRLNHRLSGRAAYAESIANNLTAGAYYVTVAVGTPGEQMSLTFDTGSSDAWVVAYTADLCTSLKLQYEYGTTCGPTCLLLSSLRRPCT